MISAASDELATNFDLDEREVWQIHDCRPFRSEIVDRDPDVMKTKLPAHTLCQGKATDDLDAVNLNQHSFKGWMIRHSPAQVRDRLWLLKEGHRDIDCDLDRAALGDKIVPILHRPINDELRQGAELLVTYIGYEIRRRHNPPGRMTHTDKRLSTAYRNRPRLDFRLIPQFEPTRGHRFRDIHRGRRRHCGGYKRGNTVAKIRAAKGGREEGQHCQAELLAKFLDSHQHA